MSEFSPSDIGAVLQGIGSGLSAVAIFGAAWLGSSAWKSQTIGKRKIECAEQILNAAYNAELALSWARSTEIWPFDLAEAMEGLAASHPDTGARELAARATIVRRRLSEGSQALSDLRNSYAMAQALFGKDTRDALSLLAIQFEIVDVTTKVLMEPAASKLKANSVQLAMANINAKSYFNGTNQRNEVIKTSIATVEGSCIPILNNS